MPASRTDSTVADTLADAPQKGASVATRVRPHDILQLRSPDALDGLDDAPAWVRESLARAPFVTVRRAQLQVADETDRSRVIVEPRQLAVGVRGSTRDQRWASTVDARLVLRRLSPPDLLAAVASGEMSHESLRERDIPALRELRVLMARWRGISYAWGPAGSVGFELATGVASATPSSDLDIVLYADTPIPREEARRLHAALARSATRVDVLVETPHCGFALAEYATVPASAPLLLRTPHGPRLGRDPWDPASSSSIPRSITSSMPRSTENSTAPEPLPSGASCPSPTPRPSPERQPT